jgi:hypothetical protein
MEKIIMMYRLKDGVEMADYKRWSLEVDQKTTPYQPGVKSFHVYEIGKVEGGSAYQILEDIDVDKAGDYPPKTEAMNRVVAEWGNYCDASSVITIHGQRIEARKTG